MAAQIDPKSIDAATPTREERLARRVADLYAVDQQFRDAASLEEVTAAVNQPGARLAQIMKTVMEAYAERPAFGQRAPELATDAVTGRRTLRLLPRFETITYGELWARIGAIAGAWHHDPVRPVRAGDFVCTLGFTSGDYATVDLACSYLGAVSVPLHSTAPVTQLVPIITETQPLILAASIEYLDTAITCILASTSLAILVVFDYHPEDDDQKDAFESARRRLADAGTPALLESLNTVLERGRTLPPAPLFVPGADDNPLALLIYTSGSTGTPKGAIYPESLVTVFWRGGTLETASLPAIDINYLPLSHTYGRALLTKTLAAGGTAYFAAKSDMSTLFKDIALVRPTSFGFVPRVCELAFQWYRRELDRKASRSGDQSAIEREVKVDMRQNLFGGRIVLALCASAPLSKEIKAFIESVLDVKLHDGYGATEALDTMVDERVKRPPVIDYKLVDVPELGYFLTDKPYARGELLLKSETLIPGYYKRPDAKAEMFDEHGYYKTGDIMAEIEPDHLAYLDRRDNVLKLSQGEFVTVAKLEAVYSTSPYVRQIFVYGNSTRSFLLAVIVTNMEAIGPDKTLDDTKSLISDSLQQIAKEADLNSYEIPRDFLIETEPFTTANGLLSGIGKLLRPKLKERYGAHLEQIYADLAKAQVDELRALRHIGCDQPMIETISRAAQALSSWSTADLKPDAHFTDLGGDSLAALSFSQLIQAIFDIDLPVGVIVNPANTLQHLADYIKTERTPGAKQPTFATVHGRDSSEIRASDLTLDNFIDAQTLADATALPRPNSAAQTVLLTGANGYLGRFLCLEWLERLNPRAGKLICIIRGNDAAAARRRLDVAFDSGDTELIRHFQELAGENLEVLAGDIADLNLGLSEQTWNRLAADVDLIVHPAALVNHVLPYNQLFGPNVVGTAEIVRLALTKRMKPVTHLSSVAVFGQIDPSAFSEDADIRVISSVRAINESYANGYGNSKWASEVLLREAHDLCGLPVAVFRSDMILAHSEYTGQLNVPDVFTRLLLSLLLTGIAPYSFYEIDAQGNRQRAHYDGLPADFTAEAITTLSEQITGRFRTFHVVNPHDDSISLDQFVDWLIKADHPIQRIDNYGDWFARFETAIRALPEKQKQNSLLPLIHAYERPSPAIPASPFPTDGFQAAVQAAEIGPNKDIPHLSESFINKYVTDLRHLRLLPHTAGANHLPSTDPWRS